MLAVGDVASPVNDPELDWITGAWIGGRVSAMDALLKIGNEQTRVVPGTGPMMTWTQFKAERDLMEAVRQRLFKQIRQGDGPQDMVDGGVYPQRDQPAQPAVVAREAAVELHLQLWRGEGDLVAQERVAEAGARRQHARERAGEQDAGKRPVLAHAQVHGGDGATLPRRR